MNRHLSLVATLSVCSLLAAPAARAEDANARFTSWAETYAAADSARTRAALEPQGLTLAAARRADLSRLIQRDPRRALTQALPYRLVRAMPASIAAQLEARIDAIGSLEVLALCGLTPGAPTRIERAARIGERRYFVHAYGSSLSLHTRERIALHGIALDNHLALLDARTRRLEPTEPADATKRVVEHRGPVVIDAGDTIYFATESSAQSLERALDLAARRPGPTPQPSPWTIGTKKVLYIRVDFSDNAGDPLTTAQAQASMTQANSFLHANSYNGLTLVTTVTNTLRMPQTKASYNSSNGYTQLMADARSAAAAAGHSGSAFDFDVIAFRNMSSWGWAGLGYVGAKGLWLNGSWTWSTVSHELGHNLGLSHSNFWQAPGETIIGNGTSQEYGNPFDVMGSGDGHFNAWDKTELDWIPLADVGVASASNSFRIYDLEATTAGGLHAVRVPINSSRDYWVEFRPTGGAALSRAASINWGYSSPGVANLLDMTPWTAGANDSPLAIGRTFADPGSNLYITPTAVGGTSPESLDVTVSVGFTLGNQPPTVTLAASATQVPVSQSVTFTATAADPNGDTLAYYWDFGDTFASTNQATQSRSWGSARDVVARVTVSDMKGGSATASVVVRVGIVSSFRISGEVLENGSGVENVRIVSGSRSTFTDSAGAYTLVGLPAGSYPVSAVKAGWSFSPMAWANPVQVTTANVTGIDFNASRATYNIGGRVTSGGAGLANVTVSAGTYSAVTNGTGDYLIGGVPNGTYALTASLAGRTFREQGFVNPVQVSGVNLTGKNFYELVFNVSGEVTGAAGPHTITDGIRSATTGLSGGKWIYTLAKVPPGSWNLIGTAPGLTLTPVFTNPITVASSALTNQNFTAAAGTSYLVTGFIQEGSVPLDGVVVDGGTASSTTDTLGNYALSGVVDGTYTLTPYKPGYQFAPSSRSATVAGADSIGNDFGVLNANSPPTVMIPARAAANPVTATKVYLEVLGDDDDTEANLTYTWRTLFATAPVTYSLNANNGAKNTEVTFTKAGAYAFEVTIADLGNLKVKSQVTVLVSQAPTAAAVAPATVTLELGGERQFVATLEDQFGGLIDTGELPEWSVNGGGTITPVGRFTATEAGGPFTVSAIVGGETGTAQVTVVVGPVPRVVEAAAANPNPVDGDMTRLTVLGGDDEGEAALTYTWTAVNPPAAVSFNPPAPSNAAKSTVATFAREGSYNLQVEIKDERGLSISSYVTVVVRSGLVKLFVTPNPATVAPGGTVQLSYYGQNQSGTEVSPLPAATWTTSGGGTIAPSGLYTAGEALGSFTVTATVGLKTASGTVKVQNAVEPPPPPKPGCGCTGSGEGAVAPFALAVLLAMFVSTRRRIGKPRAALPALLAGLFLSACSNQLSAEGVGGGGGDGGYLGLGTLQQPLGEVVSGYPNDQERMLHVLINQARHSATTPNGNECGDWSADYPNVKKVPMVWNHAAGVGARFTSKHLSELGCFQHNSCCVLGDAGAGSIQCLSAGACTGSGCNKTCDAGPGSTPAARFGLLGFPQFTFENVAGNQASAYDAWCAWMQADGDRGTIYGSSTLVGTGAYQAPGTSCQGWYHTAAFGYAAVSAPHLPAASAMYAPPNPANTSALYFAANYFDRGGGSPKRGVVVVNGHCFDMEKAWGFEDNGTYETHFPDPDVLPEGCQPYYFLFLDADAGRQVYPEVGSLQVPLGQGITCPLAYDPSPQVPADCETGVQQCPQGGQQACYTRDPATLAFGECRQGWQICRNGFWSACKDMIGPFPESCDGLDNDCDGQIDEGNPNGNASCQVPAERGECKPGKFECIASRLTCRALKAPQTELCNGLDDDCDGIADDGFPLMTCGKGECFRMVPGCQNGTPGVCTPGAPSAEVADFKDNDCDGVVDNGIDCRRSDGGLGYPRACYSFALRYPDGGTMQPSLPCAPGTQLCQANGEWGPCGGEVGPSAEVCDGEDNDCDSQVDENDEIGWARCGTGQCLTFTELCQGGTPVTCTAKTQRPEQCNGVDDNCDQVIDEGCTCRLGDTHNCYTAPIYTRNQGVCHPGVRNCADGGYGRCEGQVTPSTEWCDGLDNDCDGETDDTCVPLPSDGGPVVDAGPGEEEDAGEGGDGGTEPPKKPGCGCTGAPGAEWLAGAAAIAALLRRRSNRAPRAP